jgi:hypothetical protein
MASTFPRITRFLIFLRTGWSIFGITLFLLLATEAGFRLAFGLKDRLAGKEQPSRRILEEGYGGATWPIQHYRELEQIEDRWCPYVYFRQKPFRGQTIHVGSDGTRATWEPPPVKAGEPATGRGEIRLLMLGGSSLWGFGARDDHSIPSLVAFMLYERGCRARVKNLAELGYVSTQEIVALLRELQAGYRPDVVVFYDGVNDTTSALLEGDTGLSTNERNRRAEFNLLQSPMRLAGALGGWLVKESGSYRFAQAVRQRLIGGSSAVGVDLSSVTTFASEKAFSPETIRRLSEGVVQCYEANIALAHGLGRSYGFRPLFYWQPVVFTKTTQHPAEQQEAARYGWAEPMFREVHAKINSSAGLRTEKAFRDLSSIFGGSRDLVYIDYCHTTESANRRIAVAIVEDVIALLRRAPLEGRRPGGVAGEPNQEPIP